MSRKIIFDGEHHYIADNLAELCRYSLIILNSRLQLQRYGSEGDKVEMFKKILAEEDGEFAFDILRQLSFQAEHAEPHTFRVYNERII